MWFHEHQYEYTGLPLLQNKRKRERSSWTVGVACTRSRLMTKELKKHTPSTHMVPWRIDWSTHLITRSARPKGSELKTRAGTNVWNIEMVCWNI
jgi:hypothetical protein